jgi:ABC-2 type transport system permease protein
VRQEALSAELRSAGLDPVAVQARANAASVQVQVLQPPNQHGYQQPIAGAVVAFLLYLFLQIYGGLIAQGVVAEKATRVVEILLATVRPGQLLAGKIAGIGLLGLFQLIVIGAAGAAFLVPTRVVTIPTVATAAVAGGVVWFVLGFVFYALLLAMAAAPVSRIEEVQSASLPVTLLLLMAWLLTATVELPEVFGAASPNSSLAAVAGVLSLAPPFAPVLMPIRTAAGDAPLWQVLLALALMLVSIAGVAWVAARVYANSVLRFGARVRLLDALRGPS